MKTTKPILCLLLGLVCAAGMPGQTLAATSGDDFNDNAKNVSKWGADKTIRRGVLTERNQRLEYTVNSGTIEDDAWRPWILTRFPANADWEFQFDVANSAKASIIEQVSSIGVLILTTRTNENEMYAELYSSAIGGLPSRTGFYTEIETDDEDVAYVDRESGAGVTHGAIRVAFNGTTKVLTVFYDVAVSNSYQWVQQAAFGLAGAGGDDANTDWHLADSDQFGISIYGYSVGMNILSGQMFVDNFVETGGVMPSGAQIPDPVGSFQFRFPTNSPLLTAVVNLSGTYAGITETPHHRTYAVDIAQDESGKISGMGTVDGIATPTGGNQISGLVGAVTTVSGKPSATLKGNFDILRDDTAIKAKGTISGSLEVIDLGAGTNGIAGTQKGSAKVAGIPLSMKSTPFVTPVTTNHTANLQKDWNLSLDIGRKLIGTKERTVASAQLVLPNGDTIAYRERVVKYSPKKGYTLSFTHGTNITLNPVKIDRKSSLSIKGLTFSQQGSDWEPTGGIIYYRFLGQKGTANLMDFE